MHRPRAPAGTPTEPLSKPLPWESQDCADNCLGWRDAVDPSHFPLSSTPHPHLWLQSVQPPTAPNRVATFWLLKTTLLQPIPAPASPSASLPSPTPRASLRPSPKAVEL